MPTDTCQFFMNVQIVKKYYVRNLAIVACIVRTVQ